MPEALYGASAVLDVAGNIDVIGGHSTAGTPVADVWVSPVGPAPVGLPVPPTLNLGYTWTLYNGTPHGITPYALATDGVTPVAGTFDITYNGASDLPTNAGSYDVVAKFTSADPNYVDAVITGSFYIAQATPTLTVTGGGTITYDGQPHPITATQVGIDGQTSVAGAITYTYNGSPNAPVTAGTYTAVATFTSADPNYANTSATTTITIPDPTIPTNVKAVGASTTSIRLSWDPVVVHVSGYNVYERHVLHSPRGSGVTITYALLASNIQATAVIIGVSAGTSHTYMVRSVGLDGTLSPMSALASATPLTAPYLYAIMTSGGALTSFPQAQIGQTTKFTLVATGNLPPTFSMTAGPSGMSVDPATGVVSYTPLPSDMGTVSATFVATNSVGTSQLTVQFIVLGLPTVKVTGGTYLFDGQTHAATAVAYGADGVTPIAGAFTYTYAPVQYPTSFSTSPYAEPGTYIVHATFTSSNPAYGGAAGDGMLTVLPAVPGTGGADVITLSRDTDGQHVDWTMAAMTDRVLIADSNGLTINGNGGNDTINLDYTNGNPLPAVLHLNGNFTVNGLQGANPLAGVTLDIGTGTVFFAYNPASDPVAAIRAALANGYNGGAWNGAPTATDGAITSAATLPAGALGIGYADSADGVIPGQPANTVEVRQTIEGDANLDGSVNYADALVLQANWNLGSAWDRGDFNYDGVVNGTDAVLLARSYNTSVPSSPAAPAASATTPPPSPTPASGSTPTTGQMDPTPVTTDPTDLVQGKHSKHVKKHAGTRE